MKVNKRKEAVVLSYDDQKYRAPIVSAKGKGLVAEKIIEKAEEHEIPHYEDAALVEVLNKIDLQETIPEELFRAVAEVFAFVYQLDQNAKK